ncbi:tetratricopeptide repeat protein [Actinoplanes sp. CA-054009]
MTVDDDAVTRRVFGRRPLPRSRRAGIVLIVVAVLLAAASGLVWWRAGWPVPSPGWEGTEQAGWIAGIVSAVLSLVSTIAAVVALRRPAAPGPVAGRSRGGEVLQVGRIPLTAGWLQDRSSRIDLAQAARAGRTAVLTQVLSGMGGVGKTQLAAQFARDLAGSGELDLLVWVTADSPDLIVSGYAEAARALGLAGGDVDPQTAALRFTGWLEHTGQRWLIVLDNLDTPADATGWWPPPNPAGRTVVTTRSRDAVLHTDHRTLLDVGLFTEAEAVTYLGHALGTTDDPDQIAAVAADLGYLPLAVAQAAAFIRDRQITCATYRQRLADQRERLADLSPATLPDEHRTTVAATWALSIDAADTTPPRGLARPVLDIAALLDPNGIPTAVFTSQPVLTYLHTGPASDTGERDVDEQDVDEQDVTDALHTVHRLNLITHDPHGGRVRVHALIQRATRDQLDPEQLAALARVAADALVSIWPGVERDQEAAQILRANAIALRYTTTDLLLTPAAHVVLYAAANSLGNTGLVTGAVTAFEQLFTDCLRVLGPDRRDTLAARSNLARWRGEAGDAAGAVTAFEQLLTDYLRVLGPDHPDTLTARSHLARWRGTAGDAAGAVTASEQLLTDYLRVLGPGHPNTLTARSNLAYWRGQAGDAAGAVTAFEQLLTDRLRVLGPDHPNTLTTRSHLARWRGEAGDAAGAATAFEQLLTDQLRVLGPDHPDTLTARNDLAYWRGEAGDAAGAVTAFEQLFTDQLRVLGPDHPDTLTARNDLAYWRGEAGDAAGAVTAFEQLLTDRLRVLGPDHPDTLATRSHLARWRGRAGDAADAATAFEQLLTDQLRVLGPDHPDTLTARNDLAYWRGRAGDAAGAATAFEQLFTDCLRVLGPDHPHTLATRSNLTHWRGQTENSDHT